MNEKLLEESRTSAITEYLVHNGCVLQTISKSTDNKPYLDPIGSGTFLKINNKILVITAAHVLVNISNPKTELFIATEDVRHLRYDYLKIVGVSLPSEYNSSDKYDFCFLEIEDPDGLLNISVSEQSMELIKIPDDSSYIVHGYPSAFAHAPIEDIDNKKILTYIESMGILSEKNPLDEYSTTALELYSDMDLNIVLKYSDKCEYILPPGDINKKFSDNLITPSPKGMSGGGIWVFNKVNSNEIWTASKGISLVAIMSAWNEKDEMYGVRIHHFYEFLKRELK
jgi:hypothetical protein